MRRICCFSLLIMVFLIISAIKSKEVNGFDESGYLPINFYLSRDLVSFHVTGPANKPIDADQPLGVSVLSNLPEWQVHYQASPLKGPEGEISPDRILISSPYTEGFEPTNVPRLVASGSFIGPEPAEVSRVRFRFLPSLDDRPGKYTGMISSPDGLPLPNILVVLIIEPYTSLSFSSGEITFQVTGRPGEYEADKPVRLVVASNTDDWVVMAKATPLISSLEDRRIPPDQIFVKSQKDYVRMDEEVLVARGSGGRRILEATLDFKLKTRWENVADTYSGKVIFTCQEIP